LTTGECVHLVTFGHVMAILWRSRHSIRRRRKPHAEHNVHGSMFYRTAGCANINFLRQGLENLSSDRYRETDRQRDRRDRNYTARGFAGGQYNQIDCHELTIHSGRCDVAGAK